MLANVFNPIQSKFSKIVVILFLLCIYVILFYLVFTNRFKLDFSSLYSASQTLSEGDNPYRVLLTTYLPVVKKLPANLNPPFALWLFSPFAHLNYKIALVIWSFFSFILGLIGAGIAFKYAFSSAFLQKNRVYLYLIYLSSYATLANTAIAQLGAILLFLVMMGYHFYRINRDTAAGIMWGLIVGIKIFPALLLFHVLVKKRFHVAVILLMTLLLSWLIPLFLYGTIVYHQYLAMMSQVLWYGDSWNASLFGMIFRIIIDLNHKPHSLLWVGLVYGVLFCAFLIFYLKKISAVADQQAFGLTLVMMLLLSPLGWLYYFPLLTFPLAITWLNIRNKENGAISSMFTWCLCFFLVNYPMDYIPARLMSSFPKILSIYSMHFYGVVLLFYLTHQMATFTQEITLDSIENSQTLANRRNNFFAPVLCTILSFDLLVIIMCFIKRLI